MKNHTKTTQTLSFCLLLFNVIVMQGLCESKDASRSAQLFDGMGPYERSFQTASQEAQNYLNQGMIWIQSFNHEEAKRSFLKAAELDPKCAWAWWGVAYCEGPNYNDAYIDDTRSYAAWYAIQNALARIEHAAPVEKDLIQSLAKRFTNPPPEDRSELDKAYAEAMEVVWQKYPNDPDVGELFVRGEIALQQERWEDAIWNLEIAAEIEDTLRYTEPPYWAQPVRHTLGAVYMKSGDYDKAEQTYRKDLSIWKDNGWSLYGLSQALEAQGKSDESKDILKEFNRIWAKADEPLLTTSCKCVKQLIE